MLFQLVCISCARHDNPISGQKVDLLTSVGCMLAGMSGFPLFRDQILAWLTAICTSAVYVVLFLKRLV